MLKPAIGLTLRPFSAQMVHSLRSGGASQSAYDAPKDALNSQKLE